MAQIQQYLGRFDGITLAQQNSTVTGPMPITSGNTSSPTQDIFWSQAVIDETKWDASFPYQLLWLKRVPGSVSGYKRDMARIFTLPIPPEALSLSTPFAISTTVTLGGVVEEHNGHPIHHISLSGTTGHLPLRKSRYTPSPVSRMGTVQGGLVGNAVNDKPGQVTSDFSSGATTTPENVVTTSDLNGDMSWATGYAQFHLLKTFLECYANLKKTPAGRDYRLGFANWKDGEVYLVTPVSFDMRRDAGSPMEYKYSINLKAWRRITTDELDDAISIQPNLRPAIRDPNQLGGVLSRLKAARSQLQDLKSVLVGFGGDIDVKVFNPIREVVAFCKDALGQSFTALDLPVNILQELKNTIVLAVARDTSQQSNSRLSAEVQAIRNELLGLAAHSGIGSTKNAPLAQTQQQLSQQLQGQFRLGVGETDPITQIFNDPDSNADLFDSFSLGQLSIQPAVNKKIINYKLGIRLLTRLDFETIRETVMQFIVDYSNFVGVGSAKYSSNYGLLPPVPTLRTPTDDDWELMFALNQVVIEVGKLASSTAVDDRNRLSGLDYVAALARQAGIGFQVPVSKYTIPYPVGSTLEMVAARYLGDPTRWLEIANLNNLRAPYVDELGFTLSLLVNGVGSQVQVNDASNLYVNQLVYLQSATAVRELRHVVNIRRLSDTVFVVTLDGATNLTRFTTAAAATLFAFLPQTINSTQLLYLPSTGQPAVPDWQPKGNPNIDPFDRMLKLGGVDILLTNDNDIFMTATGDSRYAVGLQNIIQRVRLMLSTPTGSMMLHPEYGLAIQPGSTVADMSAAQILSSLRQNFRFDPAFTDISSASVIVAPPSVTINAEIGITGWNQSIPLSFQVTV